MFHNNDTLHVGINATERWMEDKNISAKHDDIDIFPFIIANNYYYED